MDGKTKQSIQNIPPQEQIIPNRVPSNIMIKSSYFMTQSKEPAYITDTINELYHYISKLSPSDYSSVEIEAKLGLFDLKGSCIQGLKEVKETFKLPSYNKAERNYHLFRYDFKSGIDENTFFSIWNSVNEESKRKGSEIIKIEPINYKEIHYRSGMRRSNAFRNGQQFKEELIIKQDKQHINIKNNGKDFRITSCREEKQSGVAFDDVPVNYREKFRVSYKFRFFRLDFTIVTSGKDPEPSSNKDVLYEIEFEFEELNTFLTKEFKTFEDFKTMFKRFLQNIFCIYELTTTEYANYHIQKARQSLKDGSLFGDYFEKMENEK